MTRRYSIQILFACCGVYAQTVLDVARSREDLSIFVAVLEPTGGALVENLGEPGPMTVFAPNNDAFAAVDNIEILLNETNYTAITRVLRYHVSFDDAYELGSVEGDGIEVATSLEDARPLKVTSDPLQINEYSRVVEADLVATNGILHIIDTVLTVEEDEDEVFLAPSPQPSFEEIVFVTPTPAPNSGSTGPQGKSKKKSTSSSPSLVIVGIVIGCALAVSVFCLMCACPCETFENHDDLEEEDFWGKDYDPKDFEEEKVMK